MTGHSEMYITPASNAIDPWEIVHGALADEGITTPRRAPAASLSFVPRHLRHNGGTAASRQDLQAMAGWTPTRRSILTGILALAAGPAAAALPTADPVPFVPVTGISPRMAELVADLLRQNAVLAGLGSDADADRWADAADAVADAMDELVNERPVTIEDYAAKVTAIAEVEQPDGCGVHPLRRLAEDITVLVGEAK